MKKRLVKGSAVRCALVTGASGFVGGHLSRRLACDGWKVHCVVRSARRRGLLAGWENRLAIHVQDGSTEKLCAIVKETAPDVVFHLASLFVAEHRTDDVAALVDSNVRFAAQLLEAMTLASVSRLVNTGSAWEHYRGDEPADLYAATKQVAQNLIRFYSASTALRAVTLTLFDTYGPCDPRPKLIPMLLRIAGTKRRLSMSPGRQRLDLVHIDDITSAYLVAARRLLRPAAGRRTPETFAISSGRTWTLRQVVALASKATGKPISVDWGARPYRAREVMKPWSKGRRLPGWKANIELGRGLQDLWAASGGSSEREIL